MSINFAAIEIGSNAVRMIVGELTDSCELRVLERWSAHLRLGDSVFENGVIPENIFQQLEQTIQGLLQKSQNFSQVKVSLSATSAMRDAENGTEVVSRL
jgi:exopolyphosphatase/guanosine-5'-triphosphate,3'-diphosphate pyrophosphatase